MKIPWNAKPEDDPTTFHAYDMAGVCIGIEDIDNYTQVGPPTTIATDHGSIVACEYVNRNNLEDRIYIPGHGYNFDD